MSDGQVEKITERLNNFEMTQQKTKDKMALLEHNIEGLHKKNLEFKSQVKDMRRMLSVFNLF